MGFLILAYRKLTLRRKMDQHQSRLMEITREIQRTEEQASIMQQGIAARKELQQQQMANYSNMFYLSGQYSLFGPSQDLQAAQRNYQAAMADAQKNNKNPNQDSNVQKALTDLQSAQSAAGGVQMQNAQRNYMFQQGMAAWNQQQNSVFDMKDEANMKVLKTKETRLNQEKESLEAISKLEDAEYQGLEKAEDKEAQRTAPKFGLS